MKDIINYKKKYYYEPNIIFKKGYLLIEGESYMENPYSFYLNFLNELKYYFNTNEDLVFDIKLLYLNTSSSKCLYEILDIISENKDGEIEINWYYDDEDTLEEIEDFEEELSLKINKIKI